MMCQACGKNSAATFVKTIINGHLSEYALCPECAKKMGYADIFGDWGFNFGSLLGSVFPKSVKTESCEFCGATFDDIVKSGKVGCANCYKVFYEQLIPSIQRIHGSSAHRGKKPGSSALAVSPKKEIKPVESELSLKEKEMEKAIREQNFEYAAVLRDEIKLLKEGHGDE